MSTISRLLVRAVAAGARFIPEKAPDPLRDAHTYLGKPLNRVDGRPKVTGQARFSAEFRPKNLNSWRRHDLLWATNPIASK